MKHEEKKSSLIHKCSRRPTKEEMTETETRLRMKMKRK
jgi:hypothetical protein